MAETKTEKRAVRPPVIAVMGHIDHGKSTLLDYIRKTNVVEKEAGGITQRLSAYEFEHTTADGIVKKITFLDTPGHEAFAAMRSRGASAADLVILVVSAEDGVAPQTVEALSSINEAAVPFVVAINKIDKPNANVERTKQTLAEHSVFLEGYGGKVPFVLISAKQGTGVEELLDVVLLAAELEEITGNALAAAEGIVIESHREARAGTSATLLIKNGSLLPGTFVAAGGRIAPVRRIENFLGQVIQKASFSSPVRVAGFDDIPPVGSVFKTFLTKKEADRYLREASKKETAVSARADAAEEKKTVVPIVVKGDSAGTVEAVIQEIQKLDTETMHLKLVFEGVGTISENDVQVGGEDAIVIGFNVPVGNAARDAAERLHTTIATFNIIYKLTEWLTEEITRRTPKITSEERRGVLKVLKVFSAVKDRQVIGGSVLEGEIGRGQIVIIMRRESEIGRGKIVNLQQQKANVERITEGNQCGLQVQARTEIAPNDRLETFEVVLK